MHSTPAILLALCLSVPMAAGGLAQTPPHPAAPFAPDELQTFVRAALADRLQANDLPDKNLLHAPRIGVRDMMPQAHLTLREAALPAVDGYDLFLLSPSDAQAEADRRKTSVAFITVDEPVIAGDTATIWLGVDIAVPSQSGLVKLCCCSGKAEFRRAGNSWTFVKWSGVVCS